MEQQDIRKNLANILAARPGTGQPVEEVPEEEELPEFLVGKSKKKKKDEKKKASATPKNDLSMPQTKDSKNMVKYKEVGSQLHYHTSTGNWDVVEDLLSTNPEAIECRSQDGRTILHVACSLGHKKIVTELLARQVDINSQMENGITPLMLCVAQGQNEVVSLLLQHDPDITIRSNTDGYSALHLAVMHQQVNGAKLLLEYDSIKNPRLADMNPKNENEKKSAVKGKKSDKKAPFIDIPSCKGYTALHLAIVENETQMIQLLLDHKADTNAITLRNWTPLHFAAHMGNLELCKTFIDKDPSAVFNKNDAGETPKGVAEIKNHEHLFEILEDNKKGHKKNKTLHKSSSRGLLKRKSSISNQKRSKKKSKEGTKKETIIIDETQNVSLLDMFTLPEFEGKEGESVIDAISRDPELLQKMKENPEVFLKHLPRDMQELLIKDVEKNPYLLQEVVEMGKEVLQQVLEEHPEQLLSAMQNPMQLFKKANTPGKLMKLIRQLEENPMSVLKEEFQDDPELFLIKELQSNPRLMFLVVEKVKNTKPELLPLIRVVIGVNPNAGEEPVKKEKGLTGKMKNKVVKAAVSKFTKKMADTEDPDMEKMDLTGLTSALEGSKDMEQFREFMSADAKKNLQDSGISGPLFTMEEYYVKIDKDGNEIVEEEPEVPLPSDTSDVDKLTQHANDLDLD